VKSTFGGFVDGFNFTRRKNRRISPKSSFIIAETAGSAGGGTSSALASSPERSE